MGIWVNLSVEKKLLEVINDTPTIGLWRSLICANYDADIRPLIIMTDLIDIYALHSFFYKNQ